MTTDTEERLRQRELLRRSEGSHTAVEEQPDARAMGAESAEYTKPTIDPQWMNAWKMFPDAEGEYGVPVKLPRGQWQVGGPNALENMRRPDGGFWFRLSTPERTQADPQFECFVGECKKKMHKRIQIVSHVRAFHFEESKVHEAILKRIEQQVAAEDPRLQKLLESLELDEAGDPAPETPEATAPEGAAPESEAEQKAEPATAGKRKAH